MGESARPVHLQFLVDVVHVLRVFGLVNLSLQYCWELGVVLVGDAVDEPGACAGNEGHFADSLQLFVFVVFGGCLRALQLAAVHIIIRLSS